MIVFQLTLELNFTLSWCHEGAIQAVSSSHLSMIQWSMTAHGLSYMTFALGWGWLSQMDMNNYFATITGC